MTDYITPASWQLRHGITTTTNAIRLGEHITAASRKVDQITGRQFGPHAGAATARTFKPTSCSMVYIDDAYEITSVEVDGNDDGTFETLWAAADYETDPANGVGPDGQTGWPVTMLRAVRTLAFPTWTNRRVVKVTAKWGWAAIPAAVVEATHLLTHRLYYEVSVPGGVTAPNVDFGIPGVPLMRPYTAEGLLKPFVRTELAVGVTG